MSEKLIKFEPPEVPVAVSDRVVGDKEAIEALQRECGLVPVRDRTITDLETLGIHVKGVGVLKLQRGRTMVDQQRLSVAMAQVSAVLTEVVQSDPKKNKRRVEQVAKLGTTLGELVRRDLDAGRLAVDIERSVSPGGAPAEEPSPEQPGFAIGLPVRARTTVNVQTMNINGPNAENLKG